MSSKKKKKLLQILDEVCHIRELQDIPGFQEEAARLKDRLSDEEFRIAVVGEFSSGKSTFINAILHQDVLAHATTETTAVITRIVNVPSDDARCKTGCIITKDGQRFSLPDLKELKEYTTAQSARYQNRVAEEITSAEIYFPFIQSNHQIVLVDTPGLNGMAEEHQEQTITLVQKAHACIYLIPRSGLSESNVQFLSYLVKYQKNFIFIQNFIDEFQASQGDSVSNKLSEQKSILEKKVFAQNPDCAYDICGVSALMELASADPSIHRLYADSPSELTREDREELHRKSGFEEFYQVLRQNFHEERMYEIQYGGTSKAISYWIQSLLDYVSKKEEQAQEFYNASRDKRSLDKLDRLREKILAGEERQKESLKNFIIAKSFDIRGEECSSLAKSLEDLYDELSLQMNNLQTSLALERRREELPGELKSKIGLLMEECNTRLRQKYQILYQMLLTRIDAYSGFESPETLDLDSLEIASVSVQQPKFVAETRLKRWESELADSKKKRTDIKEEQCEILKEFEKTEIDVHSIQYSLKDIEAQRNAKLSRLGSRPARIEREEEYTAYEKHGGLGIVDFLFGDKEVTRYRTVFDDSEGQKWDQQHANIQNAYITRSGTLEKELRAAERSKSRLLQRNEVNKEKLASIEKKICQLNQQIAGERRMIEAAEKVAAREYVNALRSALLKQVREYLLGPESVLTDAKESIKIASKKTEDDFIHLAMERFGYALGQKLQWIDQTKQEKTPIILKQAENLNKICRQLKNALAAAENC